MKRSKTEKRTGFLPLEHRKFRPFGRNFQWAEIPASGRKFRPSVKTAKSFLGFLPGGVPDLLPGSSPPKISRAGTSGQEAGISGPPEISGGTSGEKFRDPSREGSQKGLSQFRSGAGTSARRPEFPPPGNSAQRAGTSGPETTRTPSHKETLLHL